MVLLRLLRRFPLVSLASLMLAASPRPVRAQDALGRVELLAAQVQSRANTLTRSSELNIDAMQSLVSELARRVDQLADACAPFNSLAAMIPDVRVTVSSMAQAAGFGSVADVEGYARDLLGAMEELRTRAQNLRASGP